MTQLLTVVVLAIVAVWTVSDLREFERFKRLEETRDRVRSYRRWAWTGFALMVGLTVASLAALGRLDQALTLPPEFADAWRSKFPDGPGAGGDAETGFVSGILFGAVFGATALLLAEYRGADGSPPELVGDVQALLPRNAREVVAAVPVALNAGFSEELLFRLTIPLLLTLTTGSPAFGLTAGVVIFGVVHWYQGWGGVAFTTAFGGLLTWQMLEGGSLRRPIVIHTAVDLVSLILRPAARIAGRRAKVRRAAADRRGQQATTTSGRT